MNKKIIVPLLVLVIIPGCIHRTEKQDHTDIKRVKRRQHRKEWRTAEWNKTFRTMTFDELAARKDELLQENDYYTATKYLEKMVSLCPDLQKLAFLMLELADAHFERGELTKAEKYYKEFRLMYPGHNRIEYASYKAILCSFYQTLQADRDQTKTQETLELTEQFLKRKDIFTTYATEAENIQMQCHQKQFTSNVAIIQDYINRGRTKSAEHRLEQIRTEYHQKLELAFIEPTILSLEIALAQKKNDDAQAAQKIEELCTKFPEHPHVLMTYNKKRSLIDRF
jgi:outer membrane assembly lipoprotein YfiO